MADFLNILDSNDCLLYAEGIKSCKRVLRSNYSSVFVGEIENHFRMTREKCQLLTQEIMHTEWIPTGRKTHTAVPLECGKWRYVSYDRRPFWGEKSITTAVTHHCWLKETNCCIDAVEKDWNRSTQSHTLSIGTLFRPPLSTWAHAR